MGDYDYNYDNYDYDYDYDEATQRYNEYNEEPKDYTISKWWPRDYGHYPGHLMEHRNLN